MVLVSWHKIGVLMVLAGIFVLLWPHISIAQGVVAGLIMAVINVGLLAFRMQRLAGMGMRQAIVTMRAGFVVRVIWLGGVVLTLFVLDPTVAIWATLLSFFVTQFYLMATVVRSLGKG